MEVNMMIKLGAIRMLLLMTMLVSSIRKETDQSIMVRVKVR